MTEFIKGQKAKLATLTASTTLEVGVQINFSTPQTVDISCFGVDAQKQLSDDRYFIFYNQKSSPEGALEQLGSQDGDQERFRVKLSSLPTTIRHLVFTATLDSEGTMSKVRDGYLRLLANGQEVVRYSFTGADFQQEKAIILGELYHKGVWRFGAVGQGFEGGLSALLEHFGGEEASPSSPPPPPKPQPPSKPKPQPSPKPEPVPYSKNSPSPSVSLTKITLEKKGDKKAVSLKKGGGTQPIHINLNWDNPNAKKKSFFGFGGGSAAPDLDLGCMFRMADGRTGVIQPLGGNFGNRDQPPYIYLDKDDRSGSAADGENLYIYRPDLIDRVMVFAMIYEGADDFTSVGGRMTITDQEGNEIFIRLNSPDPNLKFCTICTIKKVGGAIEITKEERYFPGHRFADQHFKFGFQWTKGQK